MAPQIQEAEVVQVKGLLSLRGLARYFDYYTDDGRPATDTILDLWHSGKIPPPDLRITRKSVYWKPETIERFVLLGGYN